MSPRTKQFILEQLEERILLDANPLLMLDPGQASEADQTLEVSAEVEELSLELKSPSSKEEKDPGPASKSSEIEEKSTEQDLSEAQNDLPQTIEDSAEKTAEQKAESEIEPEEISAASFIKDETTGEGLEEGENGGSQQTASGDSLKPSIFGEGSLREEPVDPLINEDFTFTYTFTNQASAGGLGTTAFGPFVDIYFPTSGLQGDYPDPQPAPPPVSDVYDGIKFVSASYEGVQLTAVEQVFDDTGIILHPYAKDVNGDPWQIAGQEGDTFVTLVLPFGSYTSEQPASEISITAHMSNLAEVDEALDIAIRSGFMFGFTPEDDPQTDPSLVNQATVTTPYLPEVVRFKKDYIGPEGETATGPNYERTYAITVDVANQMTVDNLTIVDVLPDDIEYIPGSVSGSLVDNVIWDGTTLRIELGEVTGGIGPEDVVSFDFYVGDILGDSCNKSELVVNDMELRADWTPFDDRDPFVSLVIDTEVNDNGVFNADPDRDEVFEAQPITIQKSAAKEGSGSFKQGDVIVYTLNFQISDYHALGDIKITDILPDGLTFLEDATHQPSFVITDQYGSYNDDFLVGTGNEIELIPRADLGDATEIAMDVSAALLRSGDIDGILEGGSTPAGSGGPATGTITYFATINSRYTSPDVPVYQGDTFTNSVSISASRYAYQSGVLQPDTPICIIDNADDSGSTIEIPVGSIEKSIYAINGNPLSGSVVISPGDEITYRLTYTLPTADKADLIFSDYLPLPIFDVEDPDNDGIVGSWITQFTAADINADIPAAGVTKYGPSETYFGYSGLTPTVTTDGGQNLLRYDWTAHTNPSHQSQTVDVLFTVTVNNEPFADGLFLTNLVQGTEEGNTGITSTPGLVQVQIATPELEMTKGVIEVSDNGSTDAVFTDATGPVSFTAPGSGGFRGEATITETGLDTTEIDANLEEIDAGDLVSFAITVRNVGHFSAFDVTVKDDLPAGFAIATAGQSAQGLNLSVTDGAGNALSFTDGLGNGYGDIGFDFFANGIKLTTPIGANSDSDTAQSDNILFISYDLIATTAVQPRQEMTNTAELDNYASAVDGPNFVPNGLFDEASVAVKDPGITKDFITTEIVETGSGNGVNEQDEAVVGERIFYQTKITLQEGQTVNVTLTDTLGQGLELVSIDSITIVDGSGSSRPVGTVTSSIWGDFSGFTPLLDDSNANLSYSEVENGSSSFTLGLGDLTNNDTDNLTNEILVVGYTAMAVNTTNNVSGNQLTNTAILSHQALSETGPIQVDQDPVAAGPVNIIEPQIKIVKTSVVDGTPSGPPAQEDDQDNPDFVYGQQGSLVEYTIHISHENNSGATAFDVELLDQLPSEIVPGSLVLTSASHSSLGELAGVNVFLNGSTLATNDGATDTPFDLAYGETLTITVNGQLNPVLQAGTEVLNRAEHGWTSYQNPDTNAAQPQASGFVAENDAERTGDPSDPGQLNNYDDFDPTLILIQPQATKYLVNSELTTESDATSSTSLLEPDDSDGINNGREVVIGEFLEYRVEIVIPEAQFFDFSLEDTLDPGLALVSIDSITISGDLQAKDIENRELIDRNWSTNPYNDPGDSSLNSIITYSYSNSAGDILRIDFGDIENTVESINVEEKITISYTAVATDLATNLGNGPGVSGSQLQNAANVSYFDAPDATDEIVGPVLTADSVEIIEPKLEVAKSAELFTPGSPDTPGAPGDAGDTIVYTITVRHSDETEADAFDLELSDSFENTLRVTDGPIDGATITYADNSTLDVTNQFTISGGVLQTTAGAIDLPYGAELEVAVSASIVDSLYPADEINNRVDLSWTSMDGDRSSLSNFVTGIEDKERLETATAEASVIAVPNPIIQKELVATDVTDSANGSLDATLGEILTYAITVTMPEGQTDNLQITDILSAGLDFQDLTGSTITANLRTASGSSIVFSPALGATITGTVSTLAGLRQVVFDLGDLTVTDDNSGNFTGTVLDPFQGDDRFIIEYRAVVLDIPDNDAINSEAEIFQNSATLSYENRATTVETSPVQAEEVSLVEPNLAVTKTVNGLSVPLTDADAGDSISYAIEVEHLTGSGSAAYDLFLDDPLPTAFTAPINIVSVTTTGGLVLTTDDFTINGNSLQFAASGPNTSATATIDLEVGETFMVTVQGILATTVQPNQEIVNTAEIDWTSLPGNHENNGLPNERPYQDDDEATLVVATPTMAKTGGGLLTIGETAVFSIEVILPEGQIESLVITDDLPEGLQLVGTPTLDYSFFNGIVNTDAPTITTNTGDGNDIIIDFSLVSQPAITVFADNDPDNNSIFIEIQTQILNIEDNVLGLTLVNEASLTYIDGNDQSQSSGPEQAEVVLIEPQITTTKSVVDESGDQTVSMLAEELVYTVRFTNTGNATAYETEAVDLLDSGTLFRSLDQVLYHDVAGGVTTDITSLTSFSYDQAGNRLILGSALSSSTWDIRESDYIEAIYTATVEESWFVPGAHTNEIDADWTGLAGIGNPLERIYDDSDTNNPGLSQDGDQDADDAIYFVPLQTGTIGDRVWLDQNDNGIQDAGESGLANVTVTLTGDLGFSRTAITDGNGNYLFTSLQASDYTVTVDPATLPTDLADTPTYDYDDQNLPVLTPHSAVVSLADSESNLKLDFGYALFGSLGDTVWYDANKDGNQQDGEPGLSGVSVSISADLDSNGIADYQATTTTDSSGRYLFDRLQAGLYTIVVNPATLPAAGFTPSYDLDGIASPDTAELTLLTGEEREDADFGYTGTGSIGDTLWEDQNLNGVQDPDEPGIAGVRVTISAAINQPGVIDYRTEVTTNAEGKYLFANLPATNYQILVNEADIAQDFNQTYDPDGVLDGRTSLNLGAFENNLLQDFGYAASKPEPPSPVIPPPIPPGPPLPPAPPVIPEPGDPLLALSFIDMDTDIFADEIVYGVIVDHLATAPPVFISPIYTGMAEPGTTLAIVLLDGDGNRIGYQSVMADVGGNWLAGFTGTILNDVPNEMEIHQTASTINNSTPGLFNLRTYFNSTMVELIYSQTLPDLQSLEAYTAAMVNDSLLQSHASVLDLQWDGFAGYEFFTPSTNPSGHRR